MRSALFSRALTAGFIAGALDITAAFVQYYIKTGKGPAGVLKFIASGVFGESAFTGGTIMIIAGLVFHFIIAITFTLIFFWLSKKIPALLNYKFIAAFVYAILIWCVMQFIVLPLSNAQKLSLNLKGALIAISILIICIGLPVSYMAGRAAISDRDKN